MALAESIFAKLSADAAVLAALGQVAGAAVRIYPGIAAPMAATPYVVWTEVGGSPSVTHDGASTFGDRLVQFSCVADTYLAVRDLAAALIAALDSVHLAAGELCLHCTEHDGYSEDNDKFLRHVEATFMAAPAVPA